MAKTTAIDPTRFKRIPLDKARRYIDQTTGEMVSRRFATEQSTGKKIEQRVRENKARQQSQPPAPLKLPRKSKVRYEGGKDSGWKKFKVPDIESIPGYLRLLKPNTQVMIRVKGYPTDSYDEQKKRKKRVWRTVSGSAFFANSYDTRKQQQVGDNAAHMFSDISEIAIIIKEQ